MAGPIIQGMETEYKPWGPLAAVMTGEREAMQRAANMQGLEESMLGNTIKSVEASRAVNDFSNPELEKWRQAKLAGEGMQQDAVGRLKQGTLDTDITAGNQKNRANTLEDQAKAFMTESDLVMSIPEGLAGVGAQLSPQMQQLAQQVGGIDRLKMVLPKINEMLKQQLMNTPKYMGENNQKLIQHGLDVARDSAKEDQHYKHQMALKQFETAAAEKLQDKKASFEEKNRTMEQLAAYYLNAAESAADPADKASYMESYKKAQQAAETYKVIAAREKAAADAQAQREFMDRLRPGSAPKSPVTQGQPNVIKLD